MNLHAIQVHKARIAIRFVKAKSVAILSRLSGRKIGQWNTRPAQRAQRWNKAMEQKVIFDQATKTGWQTTLGLQGLERPRSFASSVRSKRQDIFWTGETTTVLSQKDQKTNNNDLTAFKFQTSHIAADETVARFVIQAGN